MNINVKLDKFYADYHYMNAKVLLSSNNISVQGRDTLLLRGVIDLNEATIYVDLNEISKKNPIIYQFTLSCLSSSLTPHLAVSQLPPLNRLFNTIMSAVISLRKRVFGRKTKI